MRNTRFEGWGEFLSTRT